MKKPVIGITGGFGSGKSTAAGYFRALGAKVIDADKISHSLLSAMGIKKSERKKLGKVVFNDKKKLKELCGVLHPRVLKKIKKEIKRSKNKISVIDAPLLIEAGLHRDMDKVIVVKAARANQIKRLLKLGYGKSDIKKRMAGQMPLKKKMKYADFIIDNNGLKSGIKKQVKEIWNELPLAD